MQLLLALDRQPPPGLRVRLGEAIEVSLGLNVAWSPGSRANRVSTPGCLVHARWESGWLEMGYAVEAHRVLVICGCLREYWILDIIHFGWRSRLF